MGKNRESEEVYSQILARHRAEGKSRGEVQKQAKVIHEYTENLQFVWG